MKKIVIALISVCTFTITANASVRMDEPQQQYGKTTLGKECRDAGVTINRHNDNLSIKIPDESRTSASVYIDHKNGNVKSDDTRNNAVRSWSVSSSSDVDIQCRTNKE